jgi:hypothetical protein
MLRCGGSSDAVSDHAVSWKTAGPPSPTKCGRNSCVAGSGWACRSWLSAAASGSKPVTRARPAATSAA